MSTAPRRVEDAVPAPAGPLVSTKGRHPIGRRFWHQGFIVQHADDVARVPFLRRETTERVAAEATARTEIPMTIGHEPDGDYWYFTPAAVPPPREEVST